MNYYMELNGMLQVHNGRCKFIHDHAKEMTFANLGEQANLQQANHYAHSLGIDSCMCAQCLAKENRQK